MWVKKNLGRKICGSKIDLGLNNVLSLCIIEVFHNQKLPDGQISDVLLSYLSELPHIHNQNIETIGHDAQISGVLLS